MRLPVVVLAMVASVGLASAQGYPRTRDSGAVRIIENTARMTAPVTFVLSDKPVVEVGGLENDPNKEFDHKQGYLKGVVLSTGELAVIDVFRVHFFDSKGSRKLISGRQGSGPGEFLYLTSICRTRGDTIVVYDNRNRRVTVLDRSGTFVRSILSLDGSAPPFEGCLNDGTFLLSKIVRVPGPNNTIASFSQEMARYRLDGSFIDSVGSFKGAMDVATERFPTLFAGGNRLGFADGQGDILLVTLGAPTANRGITVRGSELNINPGAATIVRSADPGVPISDEDREKRMMGTIPRGTSQEEIRQRMEQMRSRSTDKNWPAHRKAHLDDDGRLWVEDYTQEYRAAHGWTAFDRAGKIIGRLMVPEAKRRFDVIGFAKDQAIVARMDEDGAQYISVYAIKPVGR